MDIPFASSITYRCAQTVLLQGSVQAGLATNSNWRLLLLFVGIKPRSSGGDFSHLFLPATPSSWSLTLERLYKSTRCPSFPSNPLVFPGLQFNNYRVTRRVFSEPVTSKLHLLYTKNLAGQLKTPKVIRISAMHANFSHSPVHSGPICFHMTKNLKLPSGTNKTK